MDTNQRNSKRSRLRFSITSLLFLTTIAALVAAWLQEKQEHARTRRGLATEQARNTELIFQLEQLQSQVPDPARYRLRSEGRFEEALAVFKRTLQAQTSADARQHDTIFYIGELCSLTNKPDEAAHYLALYIEHCKTAQHSRSRLATAIDHLGSARRRQGRYEEAQSLIRQAIAIKEEIQPNHWTIPNAKRGLGQCLLDQGRFTEAEQMLLEAHNGIMAAASSIWEPQRASRVARPAECLATLYEKWGRPEEAENWQRESERIKRRFDTDLSLTSTAPGPGGIPNQR